MKSKITYVILIFITIIYSCSKDNSNDSPKQSAQFRFLGFEKDVLLPSINPGEITFFGFDFDKNLNNWKLKLVNQDNKSFPAKITSINDTPSSIKGKRIQEIKFTVPPLGYGKYSIATINKSTAQTYTDIFLVESNTFNKIQYDYQSDYSLTISGEIYGLYFFPNITNTIVSDIKTNNIVSIKLQNTRTFSEIDMDYSINANNEVEFKIPSSVSPGTYFLSVNYSHLVNSYFEKSILVFKEKPPVIKSINKNTFKGGETMIISGNNFRYKVDLGLLPFSIDDLVNPILRTYLVFKDRGGTGYKIIYPEKSDPTFNYINSSGTKINFTIPKKDFFWTKTDEQGNRVFEGEFMVRSGPYLSNPIPLKINY